MTSFNWATWQPPIGSRFDKNSESNQNQIKFKSDFDLDYLRHVSQRDWFAV